MAEKQWPNTYPYWTKGGKLWAWKVGHDAHQKMVRGFPTSKAAFDASLRYRAQLEAGLITATRSRTLRDFCERDWLPRQEARVAQGTLRKSTVEQYRRDCRNHILPALGSMRLDAITVEHVERLGDRLALPTDDRPALSNDSVRRIVNTLGYSLKLARKWRLIPHNPVTDADKPSPTRRTPTIPTVKEIERLANCAPNVQVSHLVRFTAYSGPREGEVFGLAWPNVDLTEGAERVWIVQHVYKGELVRGAKTRAGVREIVLAPQAADALRQQSAAQLVDDQPNPLGLVFPAPRGGYWRDSNFNRRVWQPMRTKAGLAGLMFQTLRYFYVSTVRAQGLPQSFTEQLVGHADERTHRGYTRPVEGSEQVIRAALGRAFTVETEETDTDE